MGRRTRCRLETPELQVQVRLPAGAARFSVPTVRLHHRAVWKCLRQLRPNAWRCGTLFAREILTLRLRVHGNGRQQERLFRQRGGQFSLQPGSSLSSESPPRPPSKPTRRFRRSLRRQPRCQHGPPDLTSNTLSASPISCGKLTPSSAACGLPLAALNQRTTVHFQ